MFSGPANTNAGISRRGWVVHDHRSDYLAPGSRGCVWIHADYLRPPAGHIGQRRFSFAQKVKAGPLAGTGLRIKPLAMTYSCMA